MSEIMNFVMWVAGVGLIVGLTTWFYYNIKNYRKLIFVKKIGSDNKVVDLVKAREYKDKDGVFWWKAKKKLSCIGKLVAFPPDNAVEIGRKGKEYATLYVGENKQPVWQVDTTKDIDNYIIEPFTSKQRIVYREKFKQALAKGRKGWMEQLPQILAVSAFVIIAAILVFGYGEFAKPVLEAEQARTKQLEYLDQMSFNMLQLNNDVQVIKSDLGIKTDQNTAIVPKYEVSK